MILEEILNEKKNIAQANEIIKGAGQADWRAPLMLAQIAHQADNRFPVDFYQDRTPFDVTHDAETFIGHYQENIIQKVRENYKEVLDNIKEGKLISLAVDIKPVEGNGNEEAVKKHKKYLTESEELKEGNIDAYIGEIKHPAVKQIIEYHRSINPERILMAYESYVQGLKTEFLSEFESKDEKNRGVINFDNLKSYMTANANKLQGDEQKNAYLLTGLALEKKEETRASQAA